MLNLSWFSHPNHLSLKKEKKKWQISISEEADNYLPGWCDSSVSLKTQQTVAFLLRKWTHLSRLLPSCCRVVKPPPKRALAPRCEGVCGQQWFFLNWRWWGEMLALCQKAPDPHVCSTAKSWVSLHWVVLFFILKSIIAAQCTCSTQKLPNSLRWLQLNQNGCYAEKPLQGRGGRPDQWTFNVGQGLCVCLVKGQRGSLINPSEIKN